jgi:hypothetical protein
MYDSVERMAITPRQALHQAPRRYAVIRRVVSVMIRMNMLSTLCYRPGVTLLIASCTLAADEGREALIRRLNTMAGTKLEERARTIEVRNSTARRLRQSFRTIVDNPLHRNAAEIVVPGVLRYYDIPDLIKATAPRSVTITRSK